MNRQRSGLLGMLAEGFSLPLIGLAVLLGVLYGLSQYEFESSGLEAKVPVDGPPVPGDPGTPPVKPTDPIQGATSESVEQALVAGDFDRAVKLAKATGSRKLQGRARLFRELTRSIRPNPFSMGKGLVQIETTSGTVYVGIIRSEGKELVLDLPDGQEARVRVEGVKSNEPVDGEEARAAIRARFERARADLGSEVSGLALHRLSFLALAAGEKTLGSSLLREALVGAEGGILVDMFGEGDFQNLHRARRVLAGLPEEDPTQLAMLPKDPDPKPRDPDPDTTSRPRDPDTTSRPRDPYPVDPDPVDPDPVDPDPVDPDPVDPDPVDPDPKPLSSDQRSTGHHELQDAATDPALNDARWKEADAAYRSGLELYRGSFGVSPRISDAAIRASLKEFQRAQDQLNSLMLQYRDHILVERRQQELNKLVIDCMKRQRVG